jgi:hypothetical protein
MTIMGRLVQRKKLDGLIASWVQYRDMVTRHTGDSSATPEEERQFLELKGLISSLLPLLVKTVSPGGLHQEVENQVRGMTDLMNRSLTLGGDGSTRPADWNEFLARWHTHYLYLNRFKGQERERGPRPKAPRAPVSGTPAADVHRTVRGLFDNWLTKFVVKVAVLFAMVVLGAKILNVDLSKAPEWGKSVARDWWGPERDLSAKTGPGGASPAAGTTQAGTNARSPAGGSTPAKENATAGQDRTIRIGGSPRSTPYSVDGQETVAAPPLPKAFGKLKEALKRVVPRPLKEGFLQPLYSQYGVEATVAMVGILLLLVAYMVFGRAR